jgi:hypothetical protein
MAKIGDIDGNGTVAANSDGLLVVKYVVGRRGAGLLSGNLVAIGAPRQTATQIECYIQSIWNFLDIDGNGQTEFNDALLFYYTLVGFRDENLLNNAGVSANATRRTSDEIVAYIDKLRTDI